MELLYSLHDCIILVIMLSCGRSTPAIMLSCDCSTPVIILSYNCSILVMFSCNCSTPVIRLSCDYSTLVIMFTCNCSTPVIMLSCECSTPVNQLLENICTAAVSLMKFRLLKQVFPVKHQTFFQRESFKIVSTNIIQVGRELATLLDPIGRLEHLWRGIFSLSHKLLMDGAKYREVQEM